MSCVSVRVCRRRRRQAAAGLASRVGVLGVSGETSSFLFFMWRTPSPSARARAFQWQGPGAFIKRVYRTENQNGE
jgi:hypothetical protein